MHRNKNKYELSDVIRRFGKEFLQKYKVSAQETKALFNILRCRTSALGGHKEVCECCGEQRYSYNSCGDRHCPKCLSTKQAIWVDDLMKNTLPIKHFHIIFTVPHSLNDICIWNAREYYRILFAAVWQTLRSFGYTHFGVESGAIAVLHSWGQNLSLHPHIHCIVPAAGYSLMGEWKNIGNNGNYLYPIHQLSKAFKGKFMDSLKRFLRKENAITGFNTQIQKAYNSKWVVHSQTALTKAENVVRYLGQYTHRVAINNNRIIDITDKHVKFISKDYRDNGKRKITSLEGVEFLRRFCLHIMPKRFVRIRRYGIYNHITKRNLELQFVEEKKPSIEELVEPNKKENKLERIKRLTGFDLGLCPKCKKGRMITVEDIPRIRSPSHNLPSLLHRLLY